MRIILIHGYKASSESNFFPWLKNSLQLVGTRAINNIVDITNYIMIDNGQPLHAFDYDKLIGGKIVVRRARKGEKIRTIDGAQRELDPGILEWPGSANWFFG